MNIQEEPRSDQDTAREESDTPRSQDQKVATRARDFIEDRDYDAFIDGDAYAPKQPIKEKECQNNSATATTYYSTNLASKNNSTGENVKQVYSCQTSHREPVVSDFGQYVSEANSIMKIQRLAPIKRNVVI